MREFKTTEDLREYLLGTPQEFGEEFYGLSGSCYSLSWKKNHWIIRVNNKKMGTVDRVDVAEDIDLRDSKLVIKINYFLRMANGSMEVFKKYLKDITKEDLV